MRNDGPGTNTTKGSSLSSIKTFLALDMPSMVWGYYGNKHLMLRVLERVVCSFFFSSFLLLSFLRGWFLYLLIPMTELISVIPIMVYAANGPNHILHLRKISYKHKPSGDPTLTI